MRTPSSSIPKKDKQTPGGSEKNRSPTKKQEDEHREEIVDEAIEESFPASDPPSTSVPGAKVRPRSG